MSELTNKNSKKGLVHILYQHSFFRTTEYKITNDHLEITDLRSLKFNKTKIPLENISTEETLKTSISKSAILAIAILPFLIFGFAFSLYQQEYNIETIIPLMVATIMGITSVIYLGLTKNIQYIFNDIVTQNDLFILYSEKDKLHTMNTFITVLKEKIVEKQFSIHSDKFVSLASRNNIRLENQPMHHLNELQNLGMLDDYLYNRIKTSITENLSGIVLDTINDKNIINFSAIKNK